MRQRSGESGQTLVALLIFIMVTMTITLTATAITIINIRGNNSVASGEAALQDAQAGIEDSLIQLERNPSYTGETLSIGSGSATITVSGTGPFTITSIGAFGNYRRTVTATAAYSASILTLTNWSETP